MKNKLIVVGSGFGGIAAALRMRAKGYEVTLLEKQADLGGRARVFTKDGFTYDAGPTVVTAPYLFNELFSLFKKNIEDYVKIVPLDLCIDLFSTMAQCLTIQVMKMRWRVKLARFQMI